VIKQIIIKDKKKKKKKSEEKERRVSFWREGVSIYVRIS